jgi:Skp family chaperone for outer membrane proteins
MRNANAILALLFAAAVAVPSHAKDCDTFVFVNNDSTTTSSSCDHHVSTKALRQTYGKYFGYVTRGDKAYLIKDAAILRQLADAYKPQTELGAKQAELGSQQAALGAQQAALGAEQARIALSGDDEAQKRLGRRQGELGKQQSELGRRQSELGRQQEEASRAAERKVAALLDTAIRSGAAKEVR